MKSLQKNFLICISIMIIISIIIVVALVYLYNIEEKLDEHKYYEIEEIEIGNELKRESIRNSYYAVISCIINFYKYYNLMYNNESSESIQAVYNILDEEYIKYKDITLDNLKTKLFPINGMIVDITNMYVSEKNQNIAIYIVNGNLRNISTSELSEFSMMLKVDMTNETYKIFLEDYIEENYPNLKIGDNIKINCEDEIKNDTYNTFVFETIPDVTYVEDMFESFKEDMIYNVKQAYEDLDKIYREKRFSSIDIFINYINNDKNNISNMKLSKYKKTEYDGYTQYVCLDNYGNYYIFNENVTMKYNVILDTYTVEIPQFVEKYNQSDEQTKVALNINKFISGINDKNYNYSYSILAESFKNNKYQNIESFKQYIKQNLFESNKVQFKEFSQQGSNYIYKIKILNQNSEEEKDMIIIMKLYEGTEFEMSFSIE